MTRDTRIQLGAASVLLACLVSSAVLAVQMTVVAGRSKMTYTDRAEDSDRWEVSLGIAMGAFRGVFVNGLWMRANDMKEEGKFYESVELARAITRLQPRFPQVWVFHAWNLAYNISVMTQTREERWNWVNQGIALLREEGIPANPNNLLLHKELAWIFLHKIQGVTDDANPYYKRRLAEEWTAVLGPPPPRTREDQDRESVISKHAEWLRVIAQAPITREQVIRQQPAAQAIFDGIKSQLGLALELREERMQLLERVELHNAFMNSSRTYLYEQMSGPKTQALNAMLKDPALKEAWPVVIAHVRRRVLVEDFKMEPDRMIRYTQTYGPLDWRHGASHALYWAARGVEEAQEIASDRTVNKGDFDFINTDRIVVQSIQELFRSGELYFDFKASVLGQYAIWQGIPNGHYAESYGSVLDDMRKRSIARESSGRLVNINQQSAERGYSPLSQGYENFMIDVTLYYYRRGDRRRAEQWLTQLRTYADQNLSDVERRVERFTDLDRFAEAELKDSATRPAIAVNQIVSALFQAFTSGLLGRNPDLFMSQYLFAKRWHFYYMQQQARNTAINRDSARMAQMDENWEFFAGTLFFQFMQSAGLGEAGGYNEDAQAIYFAAPPELQVWVYDALVEAYKDEIDQEAKMGGKSFDQLFPQPEGLDAHRRFMQAELERRSKPISDIQRR